MSEIKPGIISILGGGASIPASGKSHDYLAQRMPQSPRIAIMETPAGFELNSDIVAGKLASFMNKRLQNYNPQIEIIAARKKGTHFSPDNHDIVAPILMADEIVLGPGSPTYGARQLIGSLALAYIKARQWQGGTLLVSSSATLSFSQYTMPVYEIYKVGEELHWKTGVNYFEDYGLDITIIPHWDNNDGGAELDTSRCYVGLARFEPLYDMLPPDQTVIGLDDHTAAMLDFQTGIGTVVGAHSITILHNGNFRQFFTGDQFDLKELGDWHLPDPAALPQSVWTAAADAWAARQAAEADPTPTPEIIDLANQRLTARSTKNWPLADQLRDQIAAQGWRVKDTSEGYELEAAG